MRMRILMALGTGLRRGDIESLKIDDADFTGKSADHIGTGCLGDPRVGLDDLGDMPACVGAERADLLLPSGTECGIV